MHSIRSCCRLFHHRRTVWIPPVAFIIAFLIYLSFFTNSLNPVDRVEELDYNSCMCGLCRPEKPRTEWYNEHFNRSIEPLLTRKDQEIPEHVHKWWLKLQGSNNASSITEVLEQIFRVIPTGNPYAEKNNRPCRTCAVVGNSGNLKGSGQGNLIDSHGLIFRMNGARTSGFEEDVGSRTTHHFMYPESAVHLQHGVHLVLIPFKLLDLKWITSALTTGEIKSTYTRVKQFIKADKDKVLIFNPAFFKYIHDNWTNHHGKYPSTGMLAVFFALHICDEISVFGFGADKNGNWHHYWEKNRFAGAFRFTGVHNAEFESMLITKLDKEGKLKFYK
ncbi:CMP-N-acetylneuraminate-beta-galactosamide-alpha-2,3-sialyltransferase 2-like [Pelobates cultripes]|uniref:CMP-N-acetylneuraminate-beta-galactosamide-alpha-2,3-sialyltransferase 2 n=1 Tax=Pelobates cultripes TaxID=61616 RepID=A0AAD1S4R1_PELCU|nr:CMP-N-acetylneuraminate-beta-galactosamide-alpha-2,3-sialyltransferase 2-like [Pelobates cultripes]